MRADRLTTTFSALSDPTRRAILSRLASGEATVGDLAKPFRMSMPAVSRHIKVLARAGLIEQGREAQWRPCRLQPKPLEEVSHWIERYRVIWEQRFDRLDEYLRAVQAKERKTQHGRKKR